MQLPKKMEDEKFIQTYMQEKGRIVELHPKKSQSQLLEAKTTIGSLPKWISNNQTNTGLVTFSCKGLFPLNQMILENMFI